MPKIKNHRGAKKRVYLTGNKKMKRRHAAKSHNRIKKTAGNKRDYRHSCDVSRGDKHRMKKLLPHL